MPSMHKVVLKLGRHKHLAAYFLFALMYNYKNTKNAKNKTLATFGII